MKRIYSASKYAKPYELYCKKNYGKRAEEICTLAENYYREFLKQMPDLGGKDNFMAANMLDWFTIISFYEASNHEIDGKALLEIKETAVNRLKFLKPFVNGNKSKWPYKLFKKMYVAYEKQLREHRKKGEWTDSWDVAINPENRSEGFSFHLIGCPIARHAKEHGYEELLTYLCRTDHIAAELLHTRLIRTQTEILGGSYCDYWYVGDESPVLEKYKDLEKI